MIGNYQLLSVAEILRQRDAWQRLAAGGGFAAFVARPDPGVQATWWSGAWVPLTWDGMGGHHCVDLAPGPGGSMGQVLEVRPREPERRLRARSVREWLAGIAHALEVGRFRVIEVRGAREFDEYGFGP